MGVWIRGYVSGKPYGRFTVVLASMLNGNSVLRVHYGISMDGFLTNTGTETQLQIADVLTNATGFGIVTTTGSTDATIPSPLTASNDQTPPMQRWLHLAVAAPTITSFTPSATTWTVGFRNTFEVNSTKGQVLATGLGPTAQLNVCLSVDTAVPGWPTPAGGDLAWYTAWWSVLLQH